MKRLTYKREYMGNTCICCDNIKQLCAGGETEMFYGGAVDRLAAYEDTGLTPERLGEMDMLYTEMCRETSEYRELKGRLDKEFKGLISIKMVIDSFVEYYRQLEKDEEFAEAMLITNDDVRRYREWKSLDEQGLLLKLSCTMSPILQERKDGGNGKID